MFASLFDTFRATPAWLADHWAVSLGLLVIGAVLTLAGLHEIKQVQRDFNDIEGC